MRIFPVLIILLATRINAFPAKIVTVYGLPGCVELKNKNTRVVIDPNIGGRVLVYELNGRDIIYFNHHHDGITDGERIKRIDAGRFDFGPVKTIPSHNFYFKGKWKAEITGELSVRVTSGVDPKHNILLVRDFILDESSSKLICKQTLINKGDVPLERYLWSRTFVVGGGIYLMPVNPLSRYPQKYITYVGHDNVSLIDYNPHEEKTIELTDNILTITGQAKGKRILTDATDGWLACLFKNDLLFVKKYKVYSDKKYGGVSCFTAAVWHLKDEIYEIEPIGPVETVKPGESFSFTETTISRPLGSSDLHLLSSRITPFPCPAPSIANK